MMRKKISALFLAVIMVVTLLPTAFAAENSYSDTQGHWGEDAIDRWSGYGVISGTGSGLFDPNAPLTRAQAAQIFANLLNLSATASVAQYTDVTVGSWYYDAIAKCVAAGILNGTDSNTMSPSTYVSREELFVMFARALGIQPQASAGVTFTDSASTASWAAGYINALADMGVVGGSGDGTLAPKADIDRASVVALLDKAITAYGNTSGATVGSSSGIVLVVADNVTVMGSVETLVVAGGSAGISGSTVGSISVVGESASVSVGGSANVGQVSVTGANASVTVRGEATVSGVTIADTAQGAELTVSGDATVTAVDSAAQNVTISGDGTIEAATVSGDNTTVDTNGTDLTVSEGTTGVTENDKGVSAGDSVVTEAGEDEDAPAEDEDDEDEPSAPSRPSYTYYTVTFVSDDATLYTQRVRSGRAAERPENPTKEGYSFGGWFLSGAAYDFDSPVTGDITLVAQWNENATVTFVSEGMTLYTQEIVPGGTVTRPADPTTTQLCKIFDGWYAEGSETIYDFATPVNADLTLVAKWADAHTYVMRAIRAADAPDTTVATQEVCSVCDDAKEIVLSGNAAAQVGDSYYVELPNAFGQAANDTVILLKDSTLTETIVITENVTFDMDGYTLIFDYDGLLDLYDDGALTVEGNGTMLMEEDTSSELGYLIRMGDNSRLVIQDGQYFTGLTCIQAGGNSVAEIYNGTFDAFASYSGNYWHLNLIDNSNAEIVVYGGTFKNYNPAESHTENPVANFVADGYIVTTEKDGEDTWYTVVPLTAENSAAEVNGVYYENLTDAIAAADGQTVTMLDDASIVHDNFTTAIAGKTVGIDLNQNTLTLNHDGNYYKAVVVGASDGNNASLTISNGNLDIKSVKSTISAFNITTGCSMTLDDVEVTATGSVLFPQGDAASVTVRNSTITTSGVYAVGTNAATTDNYKVVITVENSTINMEASDGDSCGLMINVAGTMNVSDTTVNGQRQAVIVRAGTATFTNCTITAQPTKLSDGEHKFSMIDNTHNWGDGNRVAYGALIVGNQTSNSYLADAIVTVTGGSITCNPATGLEDNAYALYAVRMNNDYETQVSISNTTTVTGVVASKKDGTGSLILTGITETVATSTPEEITD